MNLECFLHDLGMILRCFGDGLGMILNYFGNYSKNIFTSVALLFTYFLIP